MRVKRRDLTRKTSKFIANCSRCRTTVPWRCGRFSQSTGNSSCDDFFIVPVLAAGIKEQKQPTHPFDPSSCNKSEPLTTAEVHSYLLGVPSQSRPHPRFSFAWDPSLLIRDLA